MNINWSTQYISIADLGTDDAQMQELGKLVESWLREHTKFKGTILWHNIRCQDSNPDRTNGFYRFVQCDDPEQNLLASPTAVPSE